MSLDKPVKPKAIGKNVTDYINRQQELKERKDAVEADRAKEIYVSLYVSMYLCVNLYLYFTLYIIFCER